METISIVLIVLGLALLCAEIFIPSFGVVGGLGLVAIVSGVILTASSVSQGIIMLIVILAIGVILMFLLYKLFASKRSPFVLKESLKEDQGSEHLKYFIGKKGEALTPLRPSGTADFDGVRLDVLTRGEFVEKGTEIEVLEIQGNRIIVATKKH